MPALAETIQHILKIPVPQDRKAVLQPLIEYIQQKRKNNEEVNLNFICTHNSRRSHFSQIWAQTAAAYYDLDANCYSGGVEVTAFNPRAVDAIKRAGFKVTKKGDENPVYFIFYSDDADPITAFSKFFDDPVNKSKNFAAVMNCAEADENCPFIPGAEIRIPVTYEDPKAFDGTPQETAKYNERSMQVASEMFFVFQMSRV